MNTFRLQIVSPDGMFFEGDAIQISLRSIDGEVAVLAGHAPYVTAIGAGECRVYIDDSKEFHSAACIGGFLRVSKELVLVAATTFEWLEDIDIERAKRAKARAEGIISSSISDEHSLEIAKIKLIRANTRLGVYEKNR